MVDMNHRNDIESLLQTGYFTTSRSKTPKPYEPRENTARIGPPLTQQRRPSPPPHATVILREPPRNNAPSVPRYVPRPPAPTVEDEAEALSKEHGSLDTASVDAPPSRGDVDQQVLLEEVHEHNPERRFVIVPNSSDSSTSRAVARIPRVSGGGTHRAGQAAFGNMCRSGRMFAPTKVWRKWHVKVNLGQKRYAVASALAASAVAPLLLARGHRISNVVEVPLVIDSDAFKSAAFAKTSAAAGLLKSVGAGPDLDKVKKSKKLRAGKGKMRGRRFRQRRGPLVVYDPEVDGKELISGFRNIAGVETSAVTDLNLLQLAPGGHLGRFIVWTSAAFKALDTIYGTTTTPSELKKDFLLPSNIISQSDLSRLINSQETQSAIREAKGGPTTRRSAVQKKNPLRNKQVMLRLNPYAAVFAKEAAQKKN
ncbi:hypothetical protein BN1723_000213 [Verticillium longisporum]|uniref:Large ribosomal subunit protein uL4 C-terminal domain-containing protein n=1 Tax=Verticillium longisporum TaxID=100787 RepID=A0A0G4KF98_VERLO|nr:hypothetical protein BN1723_000213 [Verticillium longisporum]